jgi:hypothetical protein
MSRRQLQIDGDALRVRAINLPEDSSYTASDARMQRGWLCLERAGEKRRVAPLPESWEEWGEAQLRQAWDIAGPPYVSELTAQGAATGAAARWADLPRTAAAAD